MILHIAMAFDFFTLHTLAAELDRHLRGKKIRRVGSNTEALAFSCDREQYVYARIGSGGHLCLVPGNLPTSLNAADGPERYLVQAEVAGVWAEKRDRIIRLRLCRTARDGTSTYGQLIFELIHPHIQVLLVSEASNEVLGKWVRSRKGREERVRVGQLYKPLPGRGRILPGEDDFSQLNCLLADMQGEVASTLAKLLVGMDKGLAEEVVRRMQQDAKIEVGSVGRAEWGALWQVLVDLYKKPVTGVGFVWQVNGRWLFSALEPVEWKFTFSSISEAIAWIDQRHIEETGDERGNKHFLQRLKKALQKMRRRMSALERDLEEAEDAADLERQGNILMAQLNQVTSKSGEVELLDVYDIAGQRRVKISLNPTISAAQNAQKLLKTAKKYQRRQEVLPGRMVSLSRQIESAEHFVGQLDAGDFTALDDIEHFLGEMGMGEKNTAERKKAREIAHPRRYCTGSGWSVWAGRNNKENDILTHKMAAQNDIWFHAHGYPGSHVVLRREGRKEEPSRQTLEEAASIAAYWSKGRTAKKVAVVYTTVKYVSKPRGGAPGQAVLKREKTLMVQPKLSNTP